VLVTPLEMALPLFPQIRSSLARALSLDSISPNSIAPNPVVLCPGGFKSSLHKIDVACRNRSRCSGLTFRLELPVMLKFTGTDEEREVVDKLRLLLCV
jgi:hypothetical protein